MAGARYAARGRRQRRTALESRAVQSFSGWPGTFPGIATNPMTLTRQVWDEATAASIPALAKALHVHQLAGVMDLDCYRGVRPAPRPRLLEQPDLTAPGSTWFVQQSVMDWLLSGNTLDLITSRGTDGWPATVRYRPAHQWSIEITEDGSIVGYRLQGVKVDIEDVIHVRRGHSPNAYGRGVGVVEQHLRTLDRAGLEEESERQNLRRGSVPSVAVIAPQTELSETEINESADQWDEKMSGPGRRPVILQKGTQVIPLTWSASDQQMIEARRMTLTDVANLTGMDPYWLGAPGSSHTYRSPGPMWLTLLRMTLEPMLKLFEDAWSQAWLPRGRRVRFNRLQLTRDDLQSSITTAAAARKANLWTYEEARISLDMDPDVPEPKGAPVPPSDEGGKPEPEDEQDDQEDEES